MGRLQRRLGHSAKKTKANRLTSEWTALLATQAQTDVSEAAPDGRRRRGGKAVRFLGEPAVTQQPGFTNLHVHSGEKLPQPQIHEAISGWETGRVSAGILNSLSDKRLRAFLGRQQPFNRLVSPSSQNLETHFRQSTKT